MNFAEATEYLLSLGNETLTMKLGLRNTELLLAALGNPHSDYEAVQIAGTNGKGSTAAMLDAICRAADLLTGLYTSPHLVSITERIKIEGRDISQEAFASYATEVRAVAENLVASRQLEALPTFFEHVTAIALLAFKKANVKIAILETGLGGRLDSTTAVRADTVAITPISIDHQQYLGNTLAEIAAEKAAVIRAGGRVVIAPQPDEARRVILERCRETGVTPVWTKDIGGSSNGSGYTFSTEREIFTGVHVALRGAHQLTNAATAISLAESLAERGFPITTAAIVKGLANAKHPGRLEMFADRVLLDGAHNPAGATALRGYLEDLQRRNHTPMALVFGAMIDKQLDEMTAEIFPIASEIILTEPRNARAAKGAELWSLARKHAPLAKVEIIEMSEAAMERAMASEGKLIVVTGSLYLVGEVRAWLKQPGIGNFKLSTKTNGHSQ
jgi:dihydrofolate synthase/folylpolyglutamate synthase